jgi:hypothetical protein
MSLSAADVIVAGTGGVWVAPEGEEFPADLEEPADPWVNVGYISEDGVTFTISRDTTDLMAWQTSEPVRVLTTSEPKTIAFELLQFDRTTLALALHGGEFDGSDPTTYTPPDAGSTDVRSMVVDAIDGDSQTRFLLPRVSVQGDVEWQLVRTDAIRLPLTFGLLASDEKWQIVSDAPGFEEGTRAATAAGKAAQAKAAAAAAA